MKKTRCKELDKEFFNISEGFTLIELVVAISLIAILFSISIPAFSLWNSSIKLSSSQKELISNLRLTQQKAITTQINHSVNFNTDTNSYFIIKKDDGKILETVFQKNTISFSSINLNPSSSEIEFNASGVPSSTGEISIINNKNKTKAIEIQPSGFAKGN